GRSRGTFLACSSASSTSRRRLRRASSPTSIPNWIGSASPCSIGIPIGVLAQKRSCACSSPRPTPEPMREGAATTPRAAPSRAVRLRAAQRDRLLGARDDAEAARLALSGAGRIRGLPPVRPALHLGEEAERVEVDVLDPSDVEHVVRADLDAVSLALAARA